MVLADGSVVKAGGKVVKNVAGYDLGKLFAGSWGTLGILTELTYKTNPRPPAMERLDFTSPNVAHALRAGLEIHAARLQPAYLTVYTRQGAALAVGLHGGEETVRWQAAEITSRLTALGLEPAQDGPAEPALRHLVAESTAPIKARLTVRTTDLPLLATFLLSAAQSAAMMVHVAVGLVEAALEGPTSGREGEQLSLRLREAVPAGGHLVWSAVPEDWRIRLGDIWGPERGDFALMRGIKQALDPQSVFSPGRFAGRL
jgi:glycolate oxidase FAD binding subunit